MSKKNNRLLSYLSKTKEVFRTIIESLLPFLLDIKYSKKIKEKMNKLNETELDSIELDKLEYSSDLTQIPINIIENSYNDCLKRKNTIEDKAKVNVIGVTIFISLISSLSSYILKIYSYTNNRLIRIGIFLCCFITIFYMLYGGILALEVLMNKNRVYILSEEELYIQNINKKKKAYARSIELNGYSNTLRSNYVFSSYQCIKYALILLMIITSIYIFPFLNNSDDKIEQEIKTLNNNNIELRKKFDSINSGLNSSIIQRNEDEIKINNLEKENEILNTEIKRLEEQNNKSKP